MTRFTLFIVLVASFPGFGDADETGKYQKWAILADEPLRKAGLVDPAAQVVSISNWHETLGIPGKSG